MKRVWSAVLLAAVLITGATGCSRASETLSELKQDLKQDVALNVADENAVQEENTLEVPDPNDISIEETYEPGADHWRGCAGSYGQLVFCRC